MILRNKQFLLVFIFAIFVSIVSAQYEETTVQWVTVQTTTELIEIITDIPQSDIDAALNLDVGEYTTQTFPYINTQFFPKTSYEICYEHYIKCLISQGPATPVCAVNDPEEIPDGYITYNSACDLYFDNCRRDMRFWRIIDVGMCYHNSNKHANRRPTKRLYGDEFSNFTFIFDIFGPKRKEYKLWPYI